MEMVELNDAIRFKHFDKVADICDGLELQMTSRGVKDYGKWPFAIHLMGHIYSNDINSARFLWKCIPQFVKEHQPEVSAVWKIGQCMWTSDYAGVHEALRGFSWSPEVGAMVDSFSEQYRKKVFDLLSSAYSIITVPDTAKFLGLSEEDTVSYAAAQGWVLDTTTQMFSVKRMPVIADQRIDASKLQNLTEYVFHLEH